MDLYGEWIHMYIFILDPYVVDIYCISYLTKVDKYVTQEMQYILDKWKIEQSETFEWLKELGNALLNS